MRVATAVRVTTALAALCATPLLVACDGERSDVVTTSELAAPAAKLASLPAEGQTVPRPVFQRGDNLAARLPDGSVAAQDFLSFYNATYLANGPRLPLLGAQDVVWFPPQRFGDTSLEAVHRGPEDPQNPCNQPVAYPIVCADDFSTGEYCQACHDSALFVTGGGLPQMSYYSDDAQWLANWSQYGDWSASIMALAARDPVWQAQIETETQVHSGVDPTIIQDVCFRCHGAMGERQLQLDHDEDFCTDVFYATVPGILPATNRGREYPFSAQCAPIGGMAVGDNQDAYAKYGSLARDGVSCGVCHRLGPPGDDSGAWDGTDFEVFYGPLDPSLAHRQDNPVPLEHDFTATFEYDTSAIMTPDPVSALDPQPMNDDDNLRIAQAVDQKNGVSYLRQSVLCGSCHVLIVPKIPTGYAANAPLPDPSRFPFYYEYKPSDCTSTTFAADGNPVTDPCVPVSYEQATYLEWINSAFASEEDNANTCQGCHMPFVTDPADPTNHGAILAQAIEGLTPKSYRRHRMMGINLYVFEMFAQFADVLGVSLLDDRIPPSGTAQDGTTTPFIQHNLLNGESSILRQATSQANGNGLDPVTGAPTPQAAAEVAITAVDRTATELNVSVTVTNHTGHKFPSGAGFRRAFLEFAVLDAAENVMWISGSANAYGAICNGPCRQTGPGRYNLLASETSADPAEHQPHYDTISSQNQVQIYEVVSVNDAGDITSSTLALFHDAKDNRVLPRGWTPPDTLGCGSNPDAGRMIFGIRQCSAAYATKPQTEPLTRGSHIASDPHYADSTLTGSDVIRYRIPLSELGGAPASVRVTMKYQTIPPAYLAARFRDGFDPDASSFLPATEREIYLTSHLNLDLGLTSTHPDNRALPLNDAWTMNIHQATAVVP